MRPKRPGAANWDGGKSIATAPALRSYFKLKGKECHVTIRRNFSNYCDRRRNFRLYRNCGNVRVDCPCPVRDISRAVCDFAAVQRKAVRVVPKSARKNRSERLVAVFLGTGWL
jgi:hypothetical protein